MIGHAEPNPPHLFAGISDLSGYRIRPEPRPNPSLRVRFGWWATDDLSMWAVLGAWIALSLMAVAAFHRMRSRRRGVSIPPEVQLFVRRFEDELRANHPHVEVRGMIPGRFATVLAIRGQELPVSLHQLFRRCAAFPDCFAATVSRFLDELETGALERTSDHVFGDVATLILPQIRSAGWLSEQGAVFGDAALAHRSLTEDLVICYVVDEPWCMTFVCRAHLRQWGKSEDDLFHLATRNLHRLAGTELPVPRSGDEPVLLRTGDGFDAARVLLLDPDKVDGLLVAVPERDVLWIGSDTDEDLSQLMAKTEEQSQRAAHPVSPHVYRMDHGQLVQVQELGQVTQS